MFFQALSFLLLLDEALHVAGLSQSLPGTRCAPADRRAGRSQLPKQVDGSFPTRRQTDDGGRSDDTCGFLHCVPIN